MSKKSNARYLARVVIMKECLKLLDSFNEVEDLSEGNKQYATLEGMPEALKLEKWRLARILRREIEKGSR